MKKLLFLGIVALMVQSLGAVTLPSTSYSPYAGGTSSTDESFTTDGGTMVSGSYSSLRVADTSCSSLPTIGACQDCCNDEYFGSMSTCCPNGDCDDDTYEECKSLYTSCANECGRSLPIDGGLSILLILSVAGGMVKAYRVKGL